MSRGGARPGAGRPRGSVTYAEERRRVTVPLPTWALDAARGMAHDYAMSLSAYVAWLVTDEMRRAGHGPEPTQ